MTETNCPNCGAPLDHGKCLYCGTSIESVLSMALGKRVSVSFEADGRLYEFDIVLDGMDISFEANPTRFSSFGGDVVHTSFSPTARASFDGSIVPSGKHGHKGLYFVRNLFPEEMTA